MDELAGGSIKTVSSEDIDEVVGPEANLLLRRKILPEGIDGEFLEIGGVSGQHHPCGGVSVEVEKLVVLIDAVMAKTTDQAEMMGRSGQWGLEVEVAIGDVDGKKTTGSKLPKIEFQCLEGQEMDRDGRGGIGIQDDQIIAVIFGGRELKAAITEDDPAMLTAVTKISKKVWIGGDFDHRRVDFKKVHLKPISGVGRHTSRAQSDDGHRARLGAMMKKLKEIPKRAGGIVVGERKVAKGDQAGLNPMIGGAVIEEMEVPGTIGLNLMDRKEAATAIENFRAGKRNRKGKQESGKGDGQRKSSGAKICGDQKEQKRKKGEPKLRGETGLTAQKMVPDQYCRQDDRGDGADSGEERLLGQERADRERRQG